MRKILVSLIMAVMIAAPGYSLEKIYSLDDVSSPKSEMTTAATPQTPSTLEAEVTFDWLDINQAQREDRVKYYKDLLFTSDNGIYFSKDEFQNKFSQYRKDKDFKLHYMLTNNGVQEDEDAKYCAFFYKKNTLVMYAIQYKTNPHNAFYYTAFGKLYYVDVTSDKYPNFPYTSMQYNRKGQLKSAIYFVSKDLQYMYGPDKEFQGVWYKDKMYDRNGKQSLTRTNW